MKIASIVTVNGAVVRHEGWEVGYDEGSPVKSFRVTPLEPAINFYPASIEEPAPVAITVKIEGISTSALASGHLDGVQESISAQGKVNALIGRDDAYKLFERGPRRETIFVPRSVVTEIYPRGVRIFTLNGERVIGLPPEATPRAAGGFTSPSTSYTLGAAPGVGPTLARATYQTISETEFVSQEQADACGLDNRIGQREEWIENVPPVIVLFGAGRGGLGLLTGSGSGGGGSGASFFAPRGHGGAQGGSVNELVRMIGQKAGFSRVEINTPDLGMFEPLSVGAGGRWIDAIMTLVGPWNPMIFVDDENVLHVIDIEAADISAPSLVVGPDSAEGISRSVSNLPPYRSVMITGTLRRGIRVRNQQVAPAVVEDNPAVNETPHIGPSAPMPHNVIVERTYTPSQLGATFDGPDGVNWSSYTIHRRYYVDPSSGQHALTYAEDVVKSGGGVISKSIFRVEQHVFDDVAHGAVREEYGIIPGYEALTLLRRETTRYDDRSDLEGISATARLVEGLVVFSVAADGQKYKAAPIWDALGSGTMDFSASSVDSIQFVKIQTTRVEYQMVDENMGWKTTTEVDHIGGRPPRFTEEVIFQGHRAAGGGYDPRQQFCFPIDDDNGEATKSIAALWVADRAQAEMIRDRAERRGGARQERHTIEMTSYLPHLRPGMSVRLVGTPMRALNQSQSAMESTTTIAGTFFIAGFKHRSQVDGQGRPFISTVLHLRSKY